MSNKDGKGPDPNCPTSGKKKKERKDQCPGDCGKEGCCGGGASQDKKEEKKDK